MKISNPMEKLLAISSHGIIKRNLTVYRYINQILKNNQFHAAFYFAMKTGWWLGYISYDFVRRSLRLVLKTVCVWTTIQVQTTWKWTGIWPRAGLNVDRFADQQPTNIRKVSPSSPLTQNKWCETQNNNFLSFHSFLKLHACVSWLWP
jgi:hypothetical protein